MDFSVCQKYIDKFWTINTSNEKNRNHLVLYHDKIYYFFTLSFINYNTKHSPSNVFIYFIIYFTHVMWGFSVRKESQYKLLKEKQQIYEFDDTCDF